MFALVLLLLVAMARAEVCATVDDCDPAPPCHTVACALEHEWAGTCEHTRINASACCLTDEECCELAGPNQRGYCNHDCTCAGTCIFTSDRECSTSSDCDDLLSGLICRSQGECFRPYCTGGSCTCFNGTDVDLDQDGVPCPDDCDDTDASISRRITCVRDADNDNYAACPPYPESPEAEEPCLTFCVAVNDTCPLGYTDVSDEDRLSKSRTLRTDTGEVCEVVPEVTECDCCDIDKRAHPGSMYSASGPNNCHEADFDCDETTTTNVCCFNGTLDAYATSTRYLWYTSLCTESFERSTCGGCSTVNSSAVHVIGFACESNCTGDEVTTVSPGMCPNSCANECVCVDDDSEPVLGTCAKVVTSCTHVRPGLYADHEQCCALAVH